MGSVPRIQSRKDSQRWIQLNESPSIDETDEWLLELGCQKIVVGKTIQNRDILLYWMDYYHSSENSHPSLQDYNLTQNIDDGNNVLFLSLVHGNEPMGLVSLLMGAMELSMSSLSTLKNSNDPANYGKLAAIRIYFLPMVNVDAYVLNRGMGKKKGCIRPNLRYTCEDDKYALNSSNIACPFLGRGGVDLNRNFPTDWENPFKSDECYWNYAGPNPFSEPETQAIATVVEDYRIKYAISIHSRNKFVTRNFKRNPPLLIHPYTSVKPFESMPKEDADKFRAWSKVMNDNVKGYYITGTALEAINYAAGGTTIDWMYSEKNITAFVLEVVPPCLTRWCKGSGVFRNALNPSLTMKHFVSLAISEKESLNMNENSSVMSLILPFLAFLLSIILYCILSRRCKQRFFLYRVGRLFFSKMKQDPIEDNVGLKKEMEALTILCA